LESRDTPISRGTWTQCPSAGEVAIAFCDFKRGYLIVDRQGLQLLHDPFSVKPYVLFYATKRVGGGVQDFNAVRLMVFFRLNPGQAEGCCPGLAKELRLEKTMINGQDEHKQGNHLDQCWKMHLLT